MSSFASRSHRAGQVGVQECTPSMAIRKATKEFQGACFGQICHCCLKISLEKTLACKIGKLSLAKTISGSLINMAIEELEAHRKQKHHEWFFFLFLFSLFFLLFVLQNTIKSCIPIANLLVLRITSDT